MICSFLGHCHTKLGTFNLSDWCFLSVICGHWVTSHNQFPHIRWRLQEWRQRAVRSVLSAKPVDCLNCHFRICCWCVHKCIRYHTSYDVIFSFLENVKFVVLVMNYVLWSTYIGNEQQQWQWFLKKTCFKKYFIFYFTCD